MSVDTSCRVHRLVAKLIGRVLHRNTRLCVMGGQGVPKPMRCTGLEFFGPLLINQKSILGKSFEQSLQKSVQVGARVLSLFMFTGRLSGSNTKPHDGLQAEFRLH